MVTVTVAYEMIDVDLEVTETEVTVEVFAHGEQGKSAYQSYLDTTEDDPVLSEEEWSAPLNNYSAIVTLPGYPSTFPPTIGSGPGEAVAGNDSRLHAAATVSGNGITISGQQISLSIGTGATQVAAGNHGHTAAEVGAVGLTGNETVAGNKILSGQTTMPNQTAGTGDAAMNRNLAAAMFAMSPAVHQINTFTGGTVTGVGTTVGPTQAGVVLLTITNVSNASARVKLCEDFGFGDVNAGYTFGFSTPFSLRVPLAFGSLDANGSFVMRIYVCTQGTMTLPAAGADPYPANTRGICAELRQKSSGTGWEARLCARNGTASAAGTFITSSWYEISPNNITKHYDLVITSNGAGTAKLFCTAFAMSVGEYPQTWQTAPLITLTGTGVPMTNENVATFWTRPEVAVIGDGVATPGATRYVKLFQCCAVYGVAL